MVGPNSGNFAENARLAFDIWRALEGGSMPNAAGNPGAAQTSLLRYRECFKAVIGDDFDLSKLT